MKIEKLPSGSYRIRKMFDGKLYTATVPYKPSQQEALTILTNKANNRATETKITGDFEYYAKKYCSIQDNVLSPNTIRSYLGILNNLSSRFKKIHLAILTPADVQEEINDYSKDRSAKSVRNAHAYISAVIKMFRPELVLHTKLPQKVKPHKYVPTKNEVQKILNYVKGTRYYIPYKLGTYGLRRGEICAILDSDLSKTNILSINKTIVQNEAKEWIVKPFPKTTESQREIYIDDELANLIREQGYAYNGHPNSLNDYLKDIQKRLNIPRFRFHDLRGYFATELSQAGISEADILRLGGWSTPYVMKSVYRQSRIQSEQNRQKKILKVLS